MSSFLNTVKELTKKAKLEAEHGFCEDTYQEYKEEIEAIKQLISKSANLGRSHVRINPDEVIKKEHLSRNMIDIIMFDIIEFLKLEGFKCTRLPNTGYIISWKDN